MGTVDSLMNVKKIVESIPGQSVTVVSALGGLTDRLILAARSAATGSAEFREDVEEFTERHLNIIHNVVPGEIREEVAMEVNALLKRLLMIYEGVKLIGHLPEQTLDLIVSFGERMSSVIVAAMIEGAVRYDSLEFIKTEKWFGKNVAEQQLTGKLIAERFRIPFQRVVVPGFISTDKETGDITNLGRGGSDFTAALIAAALDAEILEIWTDVDGFMTADPRLVKEAFVVENMSFIESMELCTFGAKVIYPPTIYPVFHKNIPIKILNTFHPDAPGTLITDMVKDSDLRIKGVTALRNTALITVSYPVSDKGSDITNRAYNAVATQGIKIFPLANPNPDTEFLFSVAETDIRVSFDIIVKEFAPEINSGEMEVPSIRNALSTIAVVGEGMKNDSRLAARIGNTLEREGIDVLAYSSGTSDTTLTFMISKEYTEKALRHIHTLIFG